MHKPVSFVNDVSTKREGAVLIIVLPYDEVGKYMGTWSVVIYNSSRGR